MEGCTTASFSGGMSMRSAIRSAYQRLVAANRATSRPSPVMASQQSRSWGGRMASTQGISS